ncbi:MAG: hypothetical protein ABSA72_03320, partial [Nitrososphaerales archaeon]
DVLRYLHSQTLDGTLPTSIYDEISRAEYPSVQLLSKTLPEALMTRVLVLFFSTKYTKPVTIEFRHLGDEDLSVIGPKLQEFFETFALPAETRQKVLASEFTVIRVKEEKKEMPVPPQETPVEE